MSEDRSRFLLELLIKVNREVTTALDLRTVLQRLLFAAIEHVGGERGSIVVLDENGQPVLAVFVVGRDMVRPVAYNFAVVAKLPHGAFLSLRS